MGKYSLTTAQYNPISLQEMMAIPSMYTDAYNKEKAQYDEYMDRVAAIKAVVGNDDYAAVRMANYEQQRDELAKAFANNRYDKNMAIGNNTLRQIWRDDMLPLEVGVKKLDDFRKFQQAHPDYIGKNYGLKDFTENPDTLYGNILGENIKKQMQENALLESKHDIRNIKTSLAPFTYNISKWGFTMPEQQEWMGRARAYFSALQSGASPEQADAILGNDPQYQGLKSSILNIANQYDFMNQDEETRAGIAKYALEGIANGLTQDEGKEIQDHYSMQRSLAKQQELPREQAKPVRKVLVKAQNNREMRGKNTNMGTSDSVLANTMHVAGSSWAGEGSAELYTLNLVKKRLNGAILQVPRSGVGKSVADGYKDITLSKADIDNISEVGFVPSRMINKKDTYNLSVMVGTGEDSKIYDIPIEEIGGSSLKAAMDEQITKTRQRINAGFYDENGYHKFKTNNELSNAEFIRSLYNGSNNTTIQSVFENMMDGLASQVINSYESTSSHKITNSERK